MDEGDALGMEIEAVGGTAIEGVANDRSIEPVGMGGMKTKLMGATRLGIEIDVGTAILGLANHTIMGHGLLARNVVNKLTGTIEIVGSKRKGDGSLGGKSGALKYRLIALADGALLKLTL
jgi:hypothetical protein